MQVGRELGVTIHVERAKMRLIECFGLGAADRALLTSDPASTSRWRVVPMAHLRAPRLRELLKQSHGRFEAVGALDHPLDLRRRHANARGSTQKGGGGGAG